MHSKVQHGCHQNVGMLKRSQLRANGRSPQALSAGAQSVFGLREELLQQGCGVTSSSSLTAWLCSPHRSRALQDQLFLPTLQLLLLLWGCSHRQHLLAKTQETLSLLFFLFLGRRIRVGKQKMSQHQSPQVSPWQRWPLALSPRTEDPHSPHRTTHDV